MSILSTGTHLMSTDKYRREHSMGDIDARTSTAARAGAEIRHARKNRGWTQEQLAHAADVATNTLGAAEDGRATRRHQECWWRRRLRGRVAPVSSPGFCGRA